MSPLKGHGFTGCGRTGCEAALKGRSFSCAVAGAKIICHHEGALAPEGSAFLTGGAHATV